MRNARLALVLSLLLPAAAPDASAAVVRYVWNGTVTDLDSNEDNVLGTVTNGQSISGTFFYDTEDVSIGNNTYPQRAQITARLGTTNLRFFGDDVFILVDPPTYSGDRFQFLVDPPRTVKIDSGPLNYEAFNLDFVDPTGAALSSNDPPQRMLSQLFSAKAFRIRGAHATNGDEFNVGGVVTSFRRVATPGDVGFDGRRDIVLRKGKNTTLWRMDGNTRLSTKTLPALASRYELRGIGDLDSDGDSDLVFRDRTTNRLRVWIMDGDNVSEARFLGPTSVSADWILAEVANVIGDDGAELLWRNNVTGETVVWRTDGATIPQTFFLPSVNPRWRIAGAADFNLDGNDDLLWRESTTGNLNVWYLDGQGNVPSVAQLTGEPAIAYTVEGVGDYDGDRQVDVLFFRPSTGDLRLSRVTGTTLGTPTAVGTPLGTGFDIGGGVAR